MTVITKRLRSSSTLEPQLSGTLCLSMSSHHCLLQPFTSGWRHSCFNSHFWTSSSSDITVYVIMDFEMASMHVQHLWLTDLSAVKMQCMHCTVTSDTCSSVKLEAEDTDIDDGQCKVRQNSDVFTTSTSWLSCRPEQRVQDVLTKRRKQLVSNLRTSTWIIHIHSHTQTHRLLAYCRQTDRQTVWLKLTLFMCTQ